MTIDEAIIERHSVRNFKDKKIEEKVIKELNEEISLYNQEAGLSIQLITNDTDVFKGLIAHYGGFRGVSNYIALVGPSGNELDEIIGYYGERIALKAQQLGLNTCWVAATYKKRKCKAVVHKKQKLVCVLALGYGTTQGVPHKSKRMDELCKVSGKMPEWFKKGMEAAMLAPTAINKQNFTIELEENQLSFDAPASKYSLIDLGIVECHFEIGSGMKIKNHKHNYDS